MAPPLLTPRDLNRAALARQLLLERHSLAATDAVRQLLAMQDQLARAPFVGLWARTRDFSSADLRDAIRGRQVVRATMLRGTLHLMLAADLLAFRAALRTENELTLPGWHTSDGYGPRTVAPDRARALPGTSHL